MRCRSEPGLHRRLEVRADDVLHAADCSVAPQLVHRAATRVVSVTDCPVSARGSCDRAAAGSRRINSTANSFTFDILNRSEFSGGLVI